MKLFFHLTCLLYLFFSFLFVGKTSADEKLNCGDNYNLIEEVCIAKYQEKMKPSKIALGAVNVGDVYFFRTSENFIGKFQVQNVQNAAGECGVYLSSDSMFGGKTITKESDIYINNTLGVWSSKSIDLDSNGKYDLVLKRSTSEGSKESVCYLEPVNSSYHKYSNFFVSPLKRGSTLIYLAMLILFGVSSFMIAMTIFKDEGSFAVQEKFEDIENNNKQINLAKYGIIFKYSRVFFRRYFTPIVQGMKNKAKIKEKYRRSIANGGMLNAITPEDFFAFKLFLILGFPALFLAFRFLMDMDWSLALTPVVSFIGYIYPDIWMKSRIEKRKREIINAMPFVVDMLALSIEAGLDFIAAMARVIEKAPNTALTEEFEILIKEIKIGSSRADALRQLSWRVDEIVVNSFCATLIAADSVGASVGPILKILSGEIRQKRSSLIEQAGAKASTKILFPMIIFILPAVFIITFAPLALDLVGK